MFILSAGPALAQGSAESAVGQPAAARHPGREWVVQFEPMLWVPALRGDLRAPGAGRFDVETVNLDESRLAPAGEVTFQADKLSFQFSGFGFNVDDTVGAANTIGPIGAGTAVRTEFELSSIEGAVGYEIWTPIDRPEDEVRLSFDIYAGARFFDADLVLTPAAGAAFAGDGQWVQPMGGVKMNLDLPWRTGIELSVDGGGWGGDESSFAWDITVAFFWVFHDHAGVEIGFRHLQMDLQDGSGAGAFEVDSALAGLFASVIIRF